METMAKGKPNVKIASDPEGLAAHAVELFVSAARAAVEARGVFFVALSGGHTPQPFFQMLARPPHALSVPWDKVHVFWVDERYVPPDSPYSNYRLARETFLDQVAIPEGNVHPIPTDYDDVSIAARSYETTIRELFGLPDDRLPEFDLVVLGMGVDGHTGSLFPNSYAPFDTHDLACVVYKLGDTLNRITLTHPVLCAARRLVVLVSGAEKAETLKAVLHGEPDEVKYPIHMLWPALDKIAWLVDQEAAQSI
jgi:6-phosphogluconolactonase